MSDQNSQLRIAAGLVFNVGTNMEHQIEIFALLKYHLMLVSAENSIRDPRQLHPSKASIPVGSIMNVEFEFIIIR